MTSETLVLGRASRNSACLLAGQAAGQVLSLAFTVLVARGLGTRAFGQYIFAAAVASFLTIAAAYGLDLLIIRELARNPERSSEVATTAVLTRSLLWLTGGAVLSVFLIVSGSDRTTMQIFVLLGTASLVILLGNCAGAVMASREIFWPKVVAEGVGNLLRVGSAWFAVREGLGVVGVAGAVLLSSVIGSGLTALYAITRLRIRLVRVRFGDALGMIRSAAPFGIAGLLFAFYFRMHLILLSTIRGDAEAGLYGAAFKAIEAWILVPGSVMAAAYPLLARSYGRDDRAYAQACRLPTRGLLALGLPAAALIAANSGDLIRLVFGEAYLSAGPGLLLLAPLLPLIALNYVLGTGLYAAGMPRAVLRAEIVAVLVGLSVGLVLIPRFGLEGAALSASIMGLAVAACNAWSLRSRTGLVPVRGAWYPALPISLLLAVLFRYLSLPVVGEMVGGMLLFFVLFLLLGGVREDDRRWLIENLRDSSLRRVLIRLRFLPSNERESGSLECGEGRKVGLL